MTDELNNLIDELLGRYDEGEGGGETEKMPAEPQWRTTLLDCIDRNLELRDQNHGEAYKVLLYTEESDTIESVELSELVLRHPWDEPDGRWQGRDVGKLIKHKLTLFRQSQVAHELAREGVQGHQCGTVVLVVPKDRSLPFTWIELKARTVGE